MSPAPQDSLPQQRTGAPGSAGESEQIHCVPRYIVILCDYAHAVGGAERVAIDSAIGLQAAGHTVHFVAGGGEVDSGLAACGAQVHLAGVQELRAKSALDLLTSGLWSGAASRLLQGLLAGLPRGQTVVHAHSWQRALTASALSVAQDSGHPLVVTLHEYGLACPNQGFFDYRAQKICTRRALGVDCLTTHCDTRTYAHKLWRAGRVVFQRSAAGLPSKLKHVIYLSGLSRDVLAPYFGPQTRWHAVRNPIAMAPGPRAQAETNRRFLFVGRVSQEKGAALFAQAATAAGVSAAVAGSGPELASLQRAHPALQFLGWVPPSGLAATLRAARALVFPSIWYETLGMTVQEALAVGLPVIVADGTAAREWVEPGKTGLLFKHMDAVDLARCLTLLASDDGLVAAMSQRAMDRYWQDPPTVASHVAALRQVYAACVADAA